MIFSYFQKDRLVGQWQMKDLLCTVKQTDIFIQPEQHESGDKFILTFLHFCISLSTGYSVGKQITCREGLNARQE